MAFIDDEQSVEASAPVELYIWTTPSTTYRTTNQRRDFVYLSQTYRAVPTMRSSIVGATTQDADELIVDLPSTDPIVADNAYLIMPRSMTLEVWRVQRVSGTHEVIWKGDVSNFALSKGINARVRSPSSMAETLDTSVPSAFFQSQCNHTLGNRLCAKDLSPIGFTNTTTVAGVTGLVITVTSVGGQPDDWFQGGRIRRVSDGEVRMISTQKGNVLNINFPFRALNITDSVTIIVGCDKSVRTCRDKFDNVQRFGGHPNIERNPFIWASSLLRRR